MDTVAGSLGCLFMEGSINNIGSSISMHSSSQDMKHEGSLESMKDV